LFSSDATFNSVAGSDIMIDGDAGLQNCYGLNTGAADKINSIKTPLSYFPNFAKALNLIAINFGGETRTYNM